MCMHINTKCITVQYLLYIVHVYVFFCLVYILLFASTMLMLGEFNINFCLLFYIDDLGSILLDVSVKSEQEPRVNKPFTVHLPNKRKVKLEVIY